MGEEKRRRASVRSRYLSENDGCRHTSATCAQRGERESRRGCLKSAIMVIGSVRRDRSAREFRSAIGGMLARRVRATKALSLAALMEICCMDLREQLAARARLDFEEGLRIP